MVLRKVMARDMGMGGTSMGTTGRLHWVRIYQLLMGAKAFHQLLMGAKAFRQVEKAAKAKARAKAQPSMWMHSQAVY